MNQATSTTELEASLLEEVAAGVRAVLGDDLLATRASRGSTGFADPSARQAARSLIDRLAAEVVAR